MKGYYWLLALLLLVLAAVGWRRARCVTAAAQPALRPDLLEVFSPAEKVLGKTLEQLQQVAGLPDSFASFDHGREAAQWRQDGLLVQVWFSQQRCESVQITPAP